MNDLLRQNLAVAENRIAEGERHLRAVAAELKGQNGERGLAKLQLFEKLQASHIAKRDRLLKELGKPAASVGSAPDRAPSAR